MIAAFLVRKATTQADMQLWLFNFFQRPFERKQTAARSQAVRIRRPARSPAGDQTLQALWHKTRREFFPDRPEIDNYRIVWSSRKLKRTLASCNLSRRRVAVARELNHPEHLAWLEPLLYHEMCHAYLGPRQRAWHGKEFKTLERRHPRMQALSLWIKKGGWLSAVRSDRARRAQALRRMTKV